MTAPPAPRGGPAKPGENGLIRTYAPDFLLDMFANPLDAGYADAAYRRSSAGASTPNGRRAGLLLRTVALVATGLLLAVAYQQTRAGEGQSSAVRDGLVADVRSDRAQVDGLQASADDLRDQVALLRDRALDNSEANALRQLEAQTGLAAVTGDGVTVTLSDGPTPTDPLTGKVLADNQGKIVDYDLQAITNELWFDGAEAIAVNGQRLTADSSIRRAGSAIQVNLEPLEQPYKITAIGPSLAKRFGASETAADYQYLATTAGVHFQVRSTDGLVLPAAAEPHFDYAGPVPSPTPPAPSGSPSGSPSHTGGR
jgi:uncharacterized protein YlxW (UPF0749 family)